MKEKESNLNKGKTPKSRCDKLRKEILRRTLSLSKEENKYEEAMRNKTNRFKTNIKIAIGTLLMVLATVAFYSGWHPLFKYQELKTVEAVGDLLKTPQWYYIENRTATIHQQGSC